MPPPLTPEYERALEILIHRFGGRMFLKRDAVTAGVPKPIVTYLMASGYVMRTSTGFKVQFTMDGKRLPPGDR